MGAKTSVEIVTFALGAKRRCGVKSTLIPFGVSTAVAWSWIVWPSGSVAQGASHWSAPYVETDGSQTELAGKLTVNSPFTLNVPPFDVSAKSALCAPK